MLAALANARGLATPGVIIRPQDVFATSLYTGTSDASHQRITNGIDLLGRGGLVWEKTRNTTEQPYLVDTLRGATKFLSSNLTSAEGTSTGVIDAFYNNGYSSTAFNPGNTAVGWSFRRAPKFFDNVTYTGDGTSGRVIPHALGIAPGMIIVRRRDVASTWIVQHRSLGPAQFLRLEATNASASADATIWGSTSPTTTGFTVSSDSSVNAAGSTYVAYLFAHDPDTTNGIVQCGSVAIGQRASLGWQPQWLLAKPNDSTSPWYMLDATRGWAAGADKYLLANASDAEASFDFGQPDATGFTTTNGFGGSGTALIYLAIRAPI